MVHPRPLFLPAGRLPSLKALRAFEAAARLGSFSSAARELNVTHAAVSTQVKLLEEALAVRLFSRQNSGIMPTAAASQYYRSVHEAFALIRSATEELLNGRSQDVLTVSCLPNFAMNWLLPRLNDFNVLHPDVQVNVLTSTRNLDFNQDAIDVAIWWGEDWAGLESERLFSAEMAPVCSPAFLKANPLPEPSLLADVPRLYVQGSMEDWPLWLDYAGISMERPTEGMRFDSLTFALRAAVEGVGVAMGRLVLMDDEIRAGRLVQPFDIRYQPKKAWHLVYPSVLATSRKVKSFESWIVDEARAHRFRLSETSE